MAFSSSTVTIGYATKKSDYDRLLDNTQDHRSEISTIKSGTISFVGEKTFQSGTVFNATATFNGDIIDKNDQAVLAVPAYGAIGSLTIAASNAWAVSTEYLPNTTVAGSSLYRSTYTTISGSLSAYSTSNLIISTTSWASLGLTGTWRLLTRINRDSDSTSYPVGLLQRIS